MVSTICCIKGKEKTSHKRLEKGENGNIFTIQRVPQNVYSKSKSLVLDVEWAQSNDLKDKWKFNIFSLFGESFTWNG